MHKLVYNFLHYKLNKPTLTFEMVFRHFTFSPGFSPHSNRICFGCCCWCKFNLLLSGGSGEAGAGVGCVCIYVFSLCGQYGGIYLPLSIVPHAFLAHPFRSVAHFVFHYGFCACCCVPVCGFSVEIYGSWFFPLLWLCFYSLDSQFYCLL